jgi:aminopeptidase N
MTQHLAQRRHKLIQAAPLATIVSLVTTLAFTQACTSSHKKDAAIEAEAGTQTAPTRPSALTRELAHRRSHQIGHVSYTLWFGLGSQSDDYEGRAVIRFELKPKAQDHGKQLWIDFEEGQIHTLSINGQAAKPEDIKNAFDSHHITLKVSDLAPGSNRVEIAFSHPYSHNGAGLHKFKDPVDGRVYLYSNFEPYDAHRMFPCFDQPDLKASYELTAEVPEGWQVVSNTPERDVTTVDGRKSWQFPPSPVFSTYVFALHAGPYAAWKGNAGGIPIRLFSRRSIQQYVDHDEWLKVTKQGLQWYGDYFGYPYPYAKYDQVIVPDFNAGAMENVAAVTFSERYVHRSKVTQDVHRNRASTILHEMAHMWFGDLVTMRWWNGLWLNESFATFMSAKAVDSATQFKGSWQAFFDEKEWAYWEDQLVTTHPIEGPVFDTDQTDTMFDGITYGKGAAVLKQLNYLLGDDDFREGLQRYFQKYATRNTTVGDFVRMLAEASGKDLSQWQKAWLQTSGVNTLKADYACEDGKISRFSLKQSAPELAEASKELRSHRTRIGLFRLQGNRFALEAGKGGKKAEKDGPLSVVYSGPETQVPELVGQACPDFVYPNYGDYDYVKIELDPKSLETAQTKLARFEDPFLRQMIWHTLFEMVTDGKLKAQDYAEAVLSQAGSEKDTQTLEQVLKSMNNPRQDEASALKYLSPEARDKYGTRLEVFTRRHLESAPAGTDLQLVWFHAFLDSVHHPNAQSVAERIFDGKAKLSGLKIDQERRWELLAALARAGFEGAPELISAELKADNTDMGQKQAIRAEVSEPSAKTKADWLAKILAYKDRKEPPFPKLREAMRAYHQVGQEDLSRPAVDAYFAQLPKLGALNDEEYMSTFAEKMYPELCDAGISQRTTQTLAANPGLPAQIVKPLKVGRQENDRCVRARALSEAR